MAMLGFLSLRSSVTSTVFTFLSGFEWTRDVRALFLLCFVLKGMVRSVIGMWACSSMYIHMCKFGCGFSGHRTVVGLRALFDVALNMDWIVNWPLHW